MRHGIFTIDPGKATGISWGVYDRNSETIAEAMRDRGLSDSHTITGTPQRQAKVLWELWQRFDLHCREHHVPKIDIVIEEYVIRVGHAPGTKDTISIRVAWAFVGFVYAKYPLVADAIIFQLPSDAMRFNNQKILRSWEAWIVGRQHERAAFAHAGLRLMKIGLN